MKYVRAITWTAVALLLLAGGFYFTWWLAVSRTAYFTDGNTIRTPASAKNVRDVLWRPPDAMPPEINSSGDEYEPALSADGLRLCFVKGKPGDGADLFISERTSDGWSEPAPLEALNTEASELGPEFSPDGETLYFYSDRKGGFGGYDLWKSELVDGTWLEPVNLGPRINTGFNEYGAAAAPDGVQLYFSSNRPRTDAPLDDGVNWQATVREDLHQSDYDIFVAPITDTGFGAPTRVAQLNSPFNEGAPSISPVGDFIYYASDRPGGAGGFDLYRSRRLEGDHWKTESLGPPVNTAHNELDPTLGLEGFSLVFSSDRASPAPDERVYDLYVTSSREVFRQVDHVAARISLVDLLNAIWPFLLWLLLTALLLLLLLKFRKHRVYHKLSVLARCVIASLLIHALILMLLTFWQVSNSLGDYLRKPSGTQVALTTSAGVQEITEQVRGLQFSEPHVEQAAELESVDAPTPITRAEAAMQDTIRMTDAAAVEHVEQAPAPRESELAEMEQLELAEQLLTTESLAEVSTPDTQPQSQVAEHEPARPETSQLSQRSAPAIETALSQPRPDTVRVESNRRAGPEAALETQPNAQAMESSSDLAMSSSPQWATPETPASTDIDIEVASDAATAAVPEPASASPTASRLSSDVQPELPTATSSRPSMATVHVERSSRQTDLQTNVTASMPSLSSAQPMAASRSREPQVEIETQIAQADVALPASASETAQEPSIRVDVPDSMQRPAADARLAASTTSRRERVDVQSQRSASPTAIDVSPSDQDLALAPAGSAETPDLPEVEVPASDFALALDAPTMPMEAEAMAEATQAAPAAERSPRHQRVDTTPLGRERDQFAFDVSTPSVADERLQNEVSFDLDNLPEIPPLDAFAMSIDPDLDLPQIALDLPNDPAPVENPFPQRDEERRAELIEQLGGSDKTEEAVKAALDWLARHQSPDGSWDSDGFGDDCGCSGHASVESDIAVTGLATLCFLGANHTHMKDGPHQERIGRAIDWLLEQQSANGDFRGRESMYSHGIATIAVSEAYAMTGDPRLLAPIENAIDFITGARNTDVGGWRYEPGQLGDTSVLGWQVMALISAKRAGVNPPDEALEVAEDWLDVVDDRRRTGRFSYQPGRPPTVSMTAEGMFVLQLLGLDRTDRRMENAVSFIRRQQPNWRRNASTYYWYYGTLALFNHGGEEWDRWNASLKDALLPAQETDGHDAGSWSPDDRWSVIGGRVYQTAICALSLEVYYRYLPLYAAHDVERTEPRPRRSNAGRSE